MVSLRISWGTNSSPEHDLEQLDEALLEVWFLSSLLEGGRYFGLSRLCNTRGQDSIKAYVYQGEAIHSRVTILGSYDVNGSKALMIFLSPQLLLPPQFPLTSSVLQMYCSSSNDQSVPLCLWVTGAWSGLCTFRRSMGIE